MPKDEASTLERARELGPAASADSAYWLDQVDASVTNKDERLRLATELKSAYFRRLAGRSAKARKATATERAALEAVAVIVAKALERAS